MKKRKNSGQIEQFISKKETPAVVPQVEMPDEETFEECENETGETHVFGGSLGDAEAQAAYQLYLEKKAKKAKKQETAKQETAVTKEEEASEELEIASKTVTPEGDVEAEEVASASSKKPTEDTPVVAPVKPVEKKISEEMESELPSETEFEEIDLAVSEDETGSSKRGAFLWTIGILAVIASVLLIVWLWPKKDDETSATIGSTLGNGVSSGVTEGSGEVPHPTDGTVEPPVGSTDVEDTQEYSIEYSLRQNVEDAVKDLIHTYYQATSECDLDAVKALYYVPLNAPVTVEILDRKAGIIESYQNIMCYAADGLAPDELILYVYYEIKFKEIDTPAPTLTRFYLKQLEDGAWKIYNGSMSDELNQHLNKMTAHQEVISLMVQVNRAFSQACERDDKLSQLIVLLGETLPSTEGESGSEAISSDEDGLEESSMDEIEESSGESSGDSSGDTIGTTDTPGV